MNELEPKKKKMHLYLCLNVIIYSVLLYYIMLVSHVEVLLFWVISILEGIVIMSGLLATFRLNPKNYLKQTCVIAVGQAAMSFLLREQVSLSGYVPVISFGILVLFAYVFITRSILFSMIVAIAGYFMYGVIQLGIFNLLPVVVGISGSGPLTPIITFVLYVPTIWYLYKKGYGFTFNFGKYMFKYESAVLIIASLFSILALCFLFVQNQMWLALVVFLLIVAFLYYYLTKKEFSDD